MLEWFDWILGYEKYFYAIGGFVVFGITLAKFRIEWRKHTLDKPIIELHANRYPSGVVTDHRMSNDEKKLTGDCIKLRIKNVGRQPFYIESIGIFNDEEVCHTLPEVGESFSLSHTDKPREFTFPVSGIKNSFHMMTDNKKRKSFMVWGCVNHLKENQILSKKKFLIQINEETR